MWFVFESTSGAIGFRVGSTMTGSVYTGLPSLRMVLGGALIDRSVVSTSGNSTQTVLYGRRLKFRINLIKVG